MVTALSDLNWRAIRDTTRDSTSQVHPASGLDGDDKKNHGGRKPRRNPIPTLAGGSYSYLQVGRFEMKLASIDCDIERARNVADLANKPQPHLSWNMDGSNINALVCK
ncbi:hypothetical protein RRG08_055529 [Elysia crispata]|uniref:Ig-like domain-containing protein n=1 Tax=Elysia crispata TaxID=231223 RepID=A0AAE1DY07_9GAST|nr:hypothetical protein RRG08_055529 [Elysia crispata]